MTDTNELIEIAKANGATVGECMIYNSDTIMFANVAQLRATFDTVNVDSKRYKLLLDLLCTKDLTQLEHIFSAYTNEPPTKEQFTQVIDNELLKLNT